MLNYIAKIWVEVILGIFLRGVILKTLKTILFWIISFIWGLPLTLYGLVVALGCLIIGKKPQKFHHFVRFEIGVGWGGFEAGPFFFTNKQPSLFTKQHEAGHGIQNIIFGPLMLFVVSIPSALRYWFRKQNTLKKKYVFCSVFLAILTLIGLAFLIPGCIVPAIWAIVIGAIILSYAICLACWLFIKELPQYKNGNYVDYYSIWFENWAYEIGEKYFPSEE